MMGTLIWISVGAVYLSMGWVVLFYLIYRKPDEPWNENDSGDYLTASLVMLLWPFIILFFLFGFLVKGPLRLAQRLSEKLHEKDRDDTISRII